MAPQPAALDASFDTVGSLLAAIASALQDTLRLLMFADKRGWGPDEFEQVRAVEDALDEAKRDFQALAPLVGCHYYEGDRKEDSLAELRVLRLDFARHAQVLRDWLRFGGPINPLWVRDTVLLRRRLHRAQCRTARRIFNAEHEAGDASATGSRCLGAFLVYRRLRENRDARRAYAELQATAAAEAARVSAEVHDSGKSSGSSTPPSWTPSSQAYEMAPPRQQQTLVSRTSALTAGRTLPVTPSPPPPLLTLESLVPTCNTVGVFERFGDRDIAFICDFCDGHIVWEDVQRLPTARVPPPAVSSDDPTAAAAATGMTAGTRQATDDDDDDGTYPRWQASTVAASDPSEPRTVVFAPLAIANHLPPLASGWEARLWCPYCDTYLYYDSGAGDQTKYAQDEAGFSSLADFQAHLAWHHTALPLPVLSKMLPTGLTETAKESCRVM